MTSAHARAAGSASCLLTLLLGCTVSLPEIDAERFACVSDARDDDGLLPCPESHACVLERCRPRLDCQREDIDAQGCAPELDRCELLIGDETARVACVRGLQLETSTRTPTLLSDCACPDGTYCVGASAVGSVDEGIGPSLFVLTEASGPTLPLGRLGIEGEHSEARVCARACGSEVDCSAGHTCRPAVVLQEHLLSRETSTRSTVGVCMPDVLRTSSTARAQLDGEACYGAEACRSELGRTQGICQANPSTAPDHPSLPIDNTAWGVRRVLRTRYVPRPSTSFKDPGLGCVVHEECASQVCFDGRCALLCDPMQPEVCGGSGRLCRDRTVVRNFPGGGPSVEDRIFLCDR